MPLDFATNVDYVWALLPETNRRELEDTSALEHRP